MIKNENIQGLVKKFHENKLSHIFLVETNDKKACLQDILELVKIINCPQTYNESCTECNLCHLIDTNTLPSLKIIIPEEQEIKKGQMDTLKRDFATIPYLSNYNTYIINDAEKFNASSANTILKFIEEPESHLIGFLLTNNKENVIETIKSRCEIVKSYYQNEKDSITNEQLQNLVIDYLYQIEVEKKLSIVYNKSVLEEKLEKDEIIQFFKIMLDLYVKVLNGEEISPKLKALKGLHQEDVLKRIQLVNTIIERLNYNVNQNLILDYFVLSLED